MDNEEVVNGKENDTIQIKKDEIIEKEMTKKKWCRFLAILAIIAILVLIVALIKSLYDSRKAEKPVIYLYPEKKEQITVLLNYDGAITCTYPSYENGWTVVAEPNGTLRDMRGKTYYYLYWEGESKKEWDLSTGFCVRGIDTAVFLEETLEKLGLNRREANDFIVYWLPRMEKNPWNRICFQTVQYTETARLDITPAPDTIIRVFMVFEALNFPVEMPSQELTATNRTGFTVVEWGGCEITH